MLELGDPCPSCAGFGVVMGQGRGGRPLGMPCPDCAHVRAKQLALNTLQAAAIARGLANLDNFDAYGVELQPSSYYYLDWPGCSAGHITDDAGWGWVECDPATW